jgi:hypothetical protein
MDDVLKKNPMLAKQMAQAAAAQAGPGFGNFMGMAMGVPQPGQPGQPVASAMADPPAPTGAFFGNNSRSAPNPSQSAAAAAASPRREMRGPSGVDDILKTFEEVRRAEMESVGVAPPPNNSFQQQPAMVAVSELQSVVSEDFGSQADSSRGGGRRKGRRTAPIGNTLEVNA